MKVLLEKNKLLFILTFYIIALYRSKFYLKNINIFIYIPYISLKQVKNNLDFCFYIKKGFIIFFILKNIIIIKN